MARTSHRLARAAISMKYYYSLPPVAPPLLAVAAALLLLLAPATTIATAAVGESNHRLGMHHPLKFIVLAPLPQSNSPALDLMGVVSQLKERGHSVLVVTTTADAFHYLKRAAARHSSNTTAESITYVAAAPPQTDGGRQTGQHDIRKVPPKPAAPQQSWKVPVTWLEQVLLGPRLILAMQDSMAASCGNILDDEPLIQTLKDFQADAIMPTVLLPTGRSLARDSCGCVLSTALGGVPTIEVDAALATSWINPIYNPQFGSGLIPSDLHHPLAPWLKNVATWFVYKLLPLLADITPHKTKTYAALRVAHQLPRAASHCHLTNMLWWLRGDRQGKRCKAALRVIPGTFLLDYPQPLEPNHVLVGPGSARWARALVQPRDVAEFIEGATDGVILVGFGTGKISNDSTWLSLKDLEELAEGFADLAPVRVLWNLQGGMPQGAEGIRLAANTRVVGWIDYNDVLGHANTRAFVTHCGLHSALEGMFHGVPLIGIPFMFEQVHTCSKIVWREAAIISNQSPAFRTGPSVATHFTREHITQIISKVLADKQYATAASRISDALKTYARERHPYSRAADEVELALAARKLVGQQHLQPQHQEDVLRQSLQNTSAGEAVSGADQGHLSEGGDHANRQEL